MILYGGEMTTTVILDLNDLVKLVSGREVPCVVNNQKVTLSIEDDVSKRLEVIYRGIGQMDAGHHVAVDGREYVDKIIFQTHLEEQVLKLMQEKENDGRV